MGAPPASRNKAERGGIVIGAGMNHGAAKIVDAGGRSGVCTGQQSQGGPDAQLAFHLVAASVIFQIEEIVAAAQGWSSDLLLGTVIDGCQQKTFRHYVAQFLRIGAKIQRRRAYALSSSLIGDDERSRGRLKEHGAAAGQRRDRTDVEYSQQVHFELDPVLSRLLPNALNRSDTGQSAAMQSGQVAAQRLVAPPGANPPSGRQCRCHTEKRRRSIASR